MHLKRIYVRIDELVLDGVAAADPHRIEDALRATLEQALRVPGVLGAFTREGVSLERLILPAIRVNRADRLGASIADALVSGLTRLIDDDAAAASVQQSPRTNVATDTMVRPAASPEVR